MRESRPSTFIPAVKTGLSVPVPVVAHNIDSLGSNAVADIVVYGRIAAKSAIDYVK